MLSKIPNGVYTFTAVLYVLYCIILIIALFAAQSTTFLVVLNLLLYGFLAMSVFIGTISWKFKRRLPVIYWVSVVSTGLSILTLIPTGGDMNILFLVLFMVQISSNIQLLGNINSLLVSDYNKDNVSEVTAKHQEQDPRALFDTKTPLLTGSMATPIKKKRLKKRVNKRMAGL